MSRERFIRICARRLPHGRGWRIHKVYPYRLGIACRGWTSDDGTTIEEAVGRALNGLRSQLIQRMQVNDRKYQRPASPSTEAHDRLVAESGESK